MISFKDVFISYGRKESKNFATRLHNALLRQGFEVWFDQNDIPLGVDFQNQIDDGIDKAHNFIFVIAPHSVRSEFCFKEIVLAIKRRKRIIPILHVEPKDDWDKMHPTISKLNWIYMREEADLSKPLEEWVALDDFNKGLEGLIALINTEKDYVQQHTYLLHLALEWERKQRSTEALLVGKERIEAENWLSREFAPPKQPPCEPSVLHCEFISESKKNGENLMTDLFISYATQDLEIKKKILNSLSRYAITCWSNLTDIKSGVDFATSIDIGVEQADGILFLISPDSVKSTWCVHELKYAKSLNKRIIPLLIRETPEKDFPQEIIGIQYINFLDNIDHGEDREKSDFQRDIDDIVSEFKREQDYYRQHKMVLVQALRWERSQKSTSLLLRGFNLEQAKTWLDTGKKRSVNPPLAIHQSFVETSIAQIGQLTTEVFISYSRKDSDLARRLNNDLQSNDKTTWFDQESIAEGSDFETEIFRGIAQAENFLFIISPDSIESPFCAREVEYAASLNKRIITLLWRETDPSTMPAALAAVQWINFIHLGYEKGFSQLIRNLNIDRGYVQEHNKWSQKSIEWDSRSRPNDLLLRGAALDSAESWLNEAKKSGKQPAPTKLQIEYIGQSRKAALAARIRLIVFTAVFLLVSGLTIFAFYQNQIAQLQKKEAERQKALAEASAEEAKREREKAVKNEQIALELKAEAEKQEKIARDSERKASRNALEAQAQKKAAVAEKARAEAEAQQALIAQNQALEAQKEAEMRRLEAQKAKELADQEARNAEKERLKSEFSLYWFNAGRFARKSKEVFNDDTLQVILANTAYQLVETSYKNPLAVREFTPDILESLTEAYAKIYNTTLYSGEFSEVSFLGKFAAFSPSIGNLYLANLEFDSMGNNQTEISLELAIEADEHITNLIMLTQGPKGLSSEAQEKNLEKKRVVFTTSKGRLLMHKPGEFVQPQLLHGELGRANELCFAEKKQKMAIAYGSKLVFYPFEQDEKMNSVFMPASIGELLISPNQENIYVACSDKKIYKVSLDKPDKFEKIMDLSYAVNAMAYHSNSDYIAMGFANGKVGLIKESDLANKSNLKVGYLPVSHTGSITAMAFSPDQKWFVSVGLDGKMLIWNLDSKHHDFDNYESMNPAILKNQDGKVFSVGFSPDSQKIIFGDQKKLFYRIIDDKILFRANQFKISSKKLTDKQWNYFKRGNIERP
jgi:WD40 repeat protein